MCVLVFSGPKTRGNDFVYMRPTFTIFDLKWMFKEHIVEFLLHIVIFELLFQIAVSNIP